MSSYKNLIVYQKSKDLSLEVIKYFSKQKISNNLDFLIKQLLRSTCSIGANIAEGYGRHYQKSYRQFVAIARGSSFETDYWLEIMSSVPGFDKSKIDEFARKNNELIKMLTTMMKNLEQ